MMPHAAFGLSKQSQVMAKSITTNSTRSKSFAASRRTSNSRARPRHINSGKMQRKDRPPTRTLRQEPTSGFRKPAEQSCAFSNRQLAQETRKPPNSHAAGARFLLATGLH